MVRVLETTFGIAVPNLAVLSTLLMYAASNKGQDGEGSSKLFKGKTIQTYFLSPLYSMELWCWVLSPRVPNLIHTIRSRWQKGLSKEEAVSVRFTTWVTWADSSEPCSVSCFFALLFSRILPSSLCWQPRRHALEWHLLTLSYSPHDGG